MCSVAIEKEMELDIYAGKLFFFFRHSLYWSPKKIRSEYQNLSRALLSLIVQSLYM